MDPWAIGRESYGPSALVAKIKQQRLEFQSKHQKKTVAKNLLPATIILEFTEGLGLRASEGLSGLGQARRLVV